MENLQKLVSLGSQPLLNEVQPASSHASLQWLEMVLPLLVLKNGFYAFESAVHVFPLGKKGGVMDIEQWNSENLWRHEYRGLADNLLFFAEDAFGYQFCAGKSGISMFNPEDASIRHIAGDIDGWAREVLDDYEELSAYPFARDWQRINGPLQEGRRLIFKIPLVLGGKTEMANVGDIDAVEAMRFRGDLWNQIKDVPPGASIELEITE